jgi:flagellar hook protein FlgE
MFTSAISLSGMNLAQQRLGVAAHNVANAQTPGFQRQEVVATALETGGVKGQVLTTPQPGSALEADIIAQMVASHGFLANRAVFGVQQRMLGSLLDTRA